MAVTITNSSYIAVGISLSGGETLTNTTFGTITAPGYGVVANGTNPATVMNAGLIAGATLGGIQLGTGGAVTQSLGGTITGGNYGVRLAGGPGTVVNAGLIAGGETGIYGGTAADNVVNAGVIEGTTGGGVILTAAGTITNQSGGTIGGGGLGVYVRGGAGSVVNQGLITVTGFGRIAADLAAGGMISNQDGATIDGQADGVVVSGGGGTVTNAGIINGPVDAGVLLSAGGSIVQTAGGTITGGIYGVQLLGAAGTVVNAGSIIGGTLAVLLNPGTANRLVVDPGAVFSGKINGGNAAGSAVASTLELASGASVGTISGFGSQYQDFGVIAIDSGARWNLDGTVPTGTTVAFTPGGYGFLTIADPGSFSGTITGFGTGETLSLAGITATGSSYANGVLTLTEASDSIALDLPGSFTTNDFAVSNVSGDAEVTIGDTGLLGSLNVSQQLELIYIAYFNRAADSPGFSYWGAQNSQTQSAGENASTALNNIANAFAPQPETIALYPFLGESNVDLSSPAGQTGLNNFVDAAYGNLFDRAADAAGAAYWVGQLTSGAVALGAAALAIANGATGADAIEVRNKVAVALDFTTRTEVAGLGETSPLAVSFLTAAKGVLSGVDGTSLNDASVMAGENATTAFINGPANGETIAGPVDASVITITKSDQLIDPGAGSYSIQFQAGISADTLALHTGGVDQVSGFDLGTDALDFDSVLGPADTNLNGDVAALRNYVTITDQGADALVNFDPAGHGGGSTVTGLDNLVAHHAIGIT